MLSLLAWSSVQPYHEGRGESEDAQMDVTTKRILVVDDDHDCRNSISEALGGEGYQVAEAKDGFHALEMVEQFKPDLILMDIVMPGMDGEQTLRVLKNNPYHSHIPVVLTTAAKGRADRIGGDVLFKPFGIDSILLIIDTILKAHDDAGLAKGD